MRWGCFYQDRYVPAAVYLKVKSVGKPDAAIPHVRFDERRWETESWEVGLMQQFEKIAKSTDHLEPPRPSSTLLFNQLNLV